jgi:tRNA-modifying protein YgfZ
MTEALTDSNNLPTDTLPHLRALQFTGADMRAFLQTQLSSDIQQLTPSLPQFSTWCKPNGRALTLGWLFDAGESLLWFVPASNAELVAAQLAIYKLRAKVNILLLPNQVTNQGRFALPDHRSFGLAEAAITLKDATNAWLLADIVQLWPTLGGNERFLPQMLGVERLGGLSLKKGCFPGQEVIARVHYKGEVKRILARYFAVSSAELADASASEEFELVQTAFDTDQGLNMLAVVKKPAPELIAFERNGQRILLRLQT